MKPSKSKRPTATRRPQRKCNTCGELLDALEKDPPPPVNVRAIDEYLASRGRRSPRPSGPVWFKTYTDSDAVAQFDRLLSEVASGCVVEITRRGRVVASVLSPAKLETPEGLANPETMKAIRAFKAGKIKDRPLSKLEASGRHKPAAKKPPDWGVILDRKQPHVSRADFRRCLIPE